MPSPESKDVTTPLLKAVQDLMAEIRDLLGACQLLRARVESNDEVMKLFTDRIRRMEERQEDLDRRITKIENAQGTYPMAIP